MCRYISQTIAFVSVSFICLFIIYRKVAVSIPDGVIRIFLLTDPSGRTMALGSIQPLKEMNSGNILGE